MFIGKHDGMHETEEYVVRAMILAAGLGTRMRPLTDYRAKPAVPVRGRPVISLLLELLAHHGFREIMINLHHRPETIRRAVDRDHPSNVEISWSEESIPLGTGGGIRRAAPFLRESEGCIVLAGDMLLDIDLRGLFDRHLASGRDATLLLREDTRGDHFGTIGVDAKGQLCRIGKRRVSSSRIPAADSGAVEANHGLFMGVRFFSRDVLANWPVATLDRSAAGDGARRISDPKADGDQSEAHEAAFEDLRDWLVPGLEERGERIGAQRLDATSSVWEPVGTPEEYLRVNLSPPDLPSLGGGAAAWSGDIELRGDEQDVIVPRDASVATSAELRRCVVWDGERVPDEFRAHDGIFAGGHFHPCEQPDTSLESRT
jgi:NDP-sugar pyrophosphorylase family protein